MNKLDELIQILIQKTKNNEITWKREPLGYNTEYNSLSISIKTELISEKDFYNITVNDIVLSINKEQKDSLRNCIVNNKLSKYVEILDMKTYWDGVG